jgi:hypothetical protein
MSSRIARAIIRMAVALAIAPFSVGEIGAAAAQPTGTRLAAQDCLTNRYDAPVSETDGRYAGRRERREAAPATGLLGLTSCRASFVPQGLPPRPRGFPALPPTRLAALDRGSV